LDGPHAGIHRKNHREFVFPEADSVPVGEAEKLSAEAIADISNNMSSPVEIAICSR